MIDKSTPIPLYYQVMEEIKRQIKEGELNSGDKIPTESWLMNHYGVSRVTIRKAMSELITEGILESKRRRGNYVAYKHVDLPLPTITSLHRILEKAGINSSSRILSFKKEPASTILARKMMIEKGEPLIIIHRIRLANGEPISDQTTHILEKYCPNLIAKDLENRSLYDILEIDNGAEISLQHQNFYAKKPTKSEIENLDLTEHEPLLCVDARICNKANETIEYSTNYYVTTRFSYSLTLKYR